MRRTVYADKDEIYSRLMAERDNALGNQKFAGMPKYRRMWWGGRAEGLEFAARLVQDWAGEEPPEV